MSNRHDHLNPKLLVRAAGLPLSVLGLLQEQRVLYRTARRILLLQDAVHRLKPALEADLYLYIQEHGDAPGIHDIIRLKRDVYNSRLPKRLDLPERIHASGAPELARRLSSWQRALQTIAALQEQGERQWVEEEREFHTRLLTALEGETGFLRALCIASPTTYEAFCRAAAKPDRLTSRGRKLQLGLLKYLTRVVCKTSPFSFFGWVGIGRLGPEAHWPAGVPHRSYSRTNRSLLQKQAEREAQRYRVNPNLWQLGEEAAVIQREPGMLPQILYRSRETLLRVALGEDLQLFFEDAVRQREWTAAELRDFLLERLAGKLAPDEYDGLLSTLLSLQVLLPCEPWRLDYAELELGDERAALGAAFGEQEARERLQTMRRFAVLTEEDESVRLVPLYDDCILQEELVVPEQSLSRVLPELELFHRVLPVLDHKLRERLIFGEWFRRTYGDNGVCPHLPELAERWLSFQEEHAADLLQPHFNPFGDEDLAQLNELRAELWQRLASAEDLVHLSADWLERLAARIPERLLTLPHSFMLFVQPQNDGTAVLNNALSGFGRCFSRYAENGEPLRDLSQRMRDLQALSPQAGEWVDLFATFGFNANLRPQLTERFVDYTGFADGAGIRLDQLVFFHDAKRNRVRIKTRDGDEIFPLHLGQMSLSYAPPVFKWLASLPHSDSIPLNFADVMRSLRHGTERRLIRVPEVRIDSLVLARPRWYVPHEMFAESLTARSDWESYQCALRFFRDHGLPRRFYMKPSASTAPKTYAKLDDFYKPQYIDLESFPLFKLFKKQLDQVQGEVVIEPAWPDPSAVLETGGVARQIELGFEFYRRDLT